MWGDTLVPCTNVYKQQEQCKNALGLTPWPTVYIKSTNLSGSSIKLADVVDRRARPEKALRGILVSQNNIPDLGNPYTITILTSSKHKQVISDFWAHLC